MKNDGKAYKLELFHLQYKYHINVGNKFLQFNRQLKAYVLAAIVKLFHIQISSCLPFLLTQNHFNRHTYDTCFNKVEI